LARVFAVLLAITVGYTAEAVRRRTILPDDFPLVVKATSAGDWDFDAAFEFGLEIIIEGLAARAAAGRRR
jgi:Tetracyclin repressor-like, C-terminal domain